MVEQEYTLSVQRGDETVDVLSFAGLLRYRTTVDGFPAMVRIPWMPEPVWTSWDETIYWASGRENEVRVMGPSGDLAAWKWSDTRPTITEAEISLYENTRRVLIDEEPRYAQSLLTWDRLPVAPEFRPSLAELYVEDGKFLWIRPYPTRSDGLGGIVEEHRPPFEEWIVLDMSGVVAARIQVPTALEVTYIGNDELVGVWTDSVGIESVRVHPIERGGLDW